MQATNIHKRLTTRDEIARAVRFVNDSINGTGYDFREASDGFYHSLAFANSIEGEKTVIVLASFDFAYYHNLELAFYHVGHNTIPSGASWWEHWTKDQLELSEEDFDDGFEFRFNIGTNSDRQFSIHAREFSYHFETISNRL